MFLIGAITIACTWYRARRCIPKNREIRDSWPAVIPVARRLFLKPEISRANEPRARARARNNSRDARREICGVLFHFARGICNLKIFVQICLDAPQTFPYISPREKYADFHITSKTDINIKISHIKESATYFWKDVFFF